MSAKHPMGRASDEKYLEERGFAISIHQTSWYFSSIFYAQHRSES